MRAISPHENYSIQVVEGDERIVVDDHGVARQISLHKPIIANFEKTGLTHFEEEVALMSFNFSALPEGVHPLSSISVFDTEMYVEQFPAEERDSILVKIDNRLRELAKNQGSGQFVVVDPPKAERPWPSYDDMSVEKVLSAVDLLSTPHDSLAERVRLYEIENKNRKQIVDEMNRLQGNPVEGEGDGEVAATVEA